MRKVIAGAALVCSIGIAGILVSTEMSETDDPSRPAEKKQVEPSVAKVNAAKVKETIYPLNITNQQEVQERMLNSYHFFDTVKGSFHFTSNDVGYDYTVKYQLKWKDKKVQYHVKTTDLKKQTTEEQSYANGETTILYTNDKIFEKIKQDIRDKGEFLETEKAIVKNSDGSKEYHYPETDLNLGMAENSLHAKEIALGFLEDYSLWKVRGTEKMLSRNAVVIDGKFSPYYQEKLHAKTFTLWMDENTGIILKSETYTEAGEVVDRLETTDFKIRNEFEVETPKIPADFVEYSPGHPS